MPKRVLLSKLTAYDIARVKKYANFTDIQEKIFLRLCKEQLDYAIMDELRISNSKYYENKPIVFEKVFQILPELDNRK